MYVSLNNFFIIKPIKFFFLILLPGILSSCDTNTKPDNDNKTYIEIVNKSKFDVNVFPYEQRSDTNPKPEFFVPAETKTDKCKFSPSLLEFGDQFYFEYLIPVGSITVPYYDFFQDNRKKIEKGVTNTLIIPGLTSTPTNSSYLVIENNSNLIINVQRYVTLLPQLGQSIVDIQPGKSGVYILGSSITSLSNYKVGPTRDYKNFPPSFNNNGSIKPGRIYAFKYDASSVNLCSESLFDIDAQDKIWTIPTYNEPVPKGKFFTTGLLSSRANVKENGYILTGSVHYERGTVTSPHVGAVPYLGMISPYGKVTDRIIYLNTNPTGINLQSFIEDLDADRLIYFGQVYYGGISGRPCILSTTSSGNERAFYDEFINDINANQELFGYKLIKRNTNAYAVGCQLHEVDRHRNRIYIAGIDSDFDKFYHHNVFWISPEDDNVSLIDMKYIQNMLVVLAHTDTGSIVYFIDAITKELRDDIKLDNYWINGLFKIDEDYYIAGRYKSPARYEGFITRIDVESATVNTQKPLTLLPKKYSQGAGGFLYILPENDRNDGTDKDNGIVVLAGWCTADRTNGASSDYYMPWLVKYDLNNGKIWEEIYENKTGYYINSVHHNAIGTYLLEIHNDKTYHSYLVSTDPLGKMSGTMRDSLLHNSNIKASEPGGPGITVVITIDDAELLTPAVLDIKKGDSRIIEVQGTWLSYQWYVNGSLAGTGSSYTFSTSDRNLGVYDVTAVVTDSAGEKRSASCRVTVTN